QLRPRDRRLPRPAPAAGCDGATHRPLLLDEAGGAGFSSDEPLARRAEDSVAKVIEDTCKEHGLVCTPHEGAHGGLPGIIVELPGERRLKTNTILSIGEHSVRVEAFVCRKPDENHEGVYRFLLKRNRRLYGVAYTLDNV